jgi:hypothetical protein
MKTITIQVNDNDYADLVARMAATQTGSPTFGGKMLVAVQNDRPLPTDMSLVSDVEEAAFEILKARRDARRRAANQ